MKTLIALVAAAISEQTASAASIILEISGQITSVDSALTSYYSAGSPYSVSVSYDPAGPHTGSAHMTANGHELFGSAAIAIQNNVPYDEFILEYAPMNGFDIAPYDTPLLVIDFIDYTSSLFSDNSLPNPFPSLSQWGQVVANLGYEDHAANMSRRLELRVDSVNIVPEPTASFLFLLGAAFCVRRRSLRTNERSA